jgi:hypothetical protein
MCSARSTTRVLAMRQLHRAQRRRSCPGLTAGRGCTPGPDRCQCLRRRGRREVLLDGTDSRAPPYKWGWTTAVGQRRCEDGHGTRSGGSRQAKRAVMIISGSRSSRSYTAAAVSLRDRLSRSGLPEPCLTPSGAAAAALLTLLGERAQVAAYVCHATCSGRSATQGCGATPPRLDTSVHTSRRPRPVNRFQLLTALVLAAVLAVSLSTVQSASASTYSVNRLRYSTGTSTQMIVVTAGGYRTSYATLETFYRDRYGHWQRAFAPYGGPYWLQRLCAPRRQA